MSAVGQNRKCADLAVSQKRRLCDVWGMALLSRIPRFPILGILEIGGIDDEEPKSGTLRKGRGGTAASPGLAASIHAK
jgi:hypothetical protein